MNQQINLYQPIFRRQKKVFSAATMLQTSVFFLVVLTALYVYGEFSVQPLQDQLSRVNQDIVRLQGQIARLDAQAPAATPSKLLENEIAKLDAELEKRKQVQQLLSSQQVGNTKGLSGYLESFARQHVQGLWLTGFNIGDGGKLLGLRGKTLTSELVPVYITRLSNEEVLSGTAFNVMELIQPEEPAGQMEFYVSTN